MNPLKLKTQLLALALGLSTALPASHAVAAEYLWVEAEHSADVQGGNYSFITPPPLAQQRGWGIAGPGVAAEWSQVRDKKWRIAWRKAN